MSIAALFCSILITRDPMTKTPKVVAPWEVPLYINSFGGESVHVVDEEVEVAIDSLPEADEEYARLQGTFGVESETKQDHVAVIYGRGAAGVRALADAIQAAVDGPVARPAKKSAKRSAKPAPDEDAAGADPLV